MALDVVIEVAELLVRLTRSLALLFIGWLVSLWDEDAARPFWADVFGFAQALTPI